MNFLKMFIYLALIGDIFKKIIQHILLIIILFIKKLFDIISLVKNNKIGVLI